MPVDFLKCSICPKNPTFSDVSHLLTHVGSKGHLSYLHNLQVRSHQELDAAYKLAIYNQWFQEHGLAPLLSERMQQKDHKQALKKAADRCHKRPNRNKPSQKGRKTAAELQQASATSADDPPQLLTLESRASEEDLEDADYAPVPTKRGSRHPVLNSSPSQVYGSYPNLNEDAENSWIEAKSPCKGSSGTSQLKGIQWPGMDLFDAAPEDLRRRRNQKKDSSVLRSLQRNARRVRPIETVCSPAGEVLKERHMNDLEDDSPVEGEIMIRRSSPKKRKPAVSRPKNPANRAKKNPGPKKRLGRPRKRIETPSKLPSSSVADLLTSSSHVTPQRGEEREYNRTVRGIGRKRKGQDFSIYQDSSPAFGVGGSSEVMPPVYVDASTARPQLAQQRNIWHPSPPEPYDPFKLIRDRFSHYSAFPDIGHGKENVNILPSSMITPVPTSINPLFFANGTRQFSAAETFNGQNRVNPITAPDMDPFHDNDSSFLPARNPLMAALERLRSPAKAESYGFHATEVNTATTHYRQPVFAP